MVRTNYYYYYSCNVINITQHFGKIWRDTLLWILQENDPAVFQRASESFCSCANNNVGTPQHCKYTFWQYMAKVEPCAQTQVSVQQACSCSCYHYTSEQVPFSQWNLFCENFFSEWTEKGALVLTYLGRRTYRLQFCSRLIWLTHSLFASLFASTALSFIDHCFYITRLK